jgi:hypothetical protein
MRRWSKETRRCPFCGTGIWIGRGRIALSRWRKHLQSHGVSRDKGIGEIEDFREVRSRSLLMTGLGPTKSERRPVLDGKLPLKGYAPYFRRKRKYLTEKFGTVR